MGKKRTYTAFPTKPRMAKLAWVYAKETFKGEDPDELAYDVQSQLWKASYNGSTIIIEEDALQGIS